MQKFNYHTHTRRCGHADNSMEDEDFVKAFIEKGFTRIAFTDHCPEKELIDVRERMRMPYSQKDEYLASIHNLQEKYKDKIKIETGFEIEYLPGQEENLLELKRETDKLILGQHFIYNKEQTELMIFKRCEYTDEDLFRYAEYLRKAMELGIPNIIAHPDIFMLARNSGFGEADEKATRIICEAAVKYGVPLEINLTDQARILQGKLDKIRYPRKEFWKIVSEYDKLKVVYGVDAHYKEQIDRCDEAVELTKKLIGEDIINKLHFCDENLNCEF